MEEFRVFLRAIPEERMHFSSSPPLRLALTNVNEHDSSDGTKLRV
jgi:hypothetical protein